MASLNELANMVFPLVPGGQNRNHTDYSPNYEKQKKADGLEIRIKTSKYPIFIRSKWNIR